MGHGPRVCVEAALPTRVFPLAAGRCPAVCDKSRREAILARPLFTAAQTITAAVGAVDAAGQPVGRSAPWPHPAAFRGRGRRTPAPGRLKGRIGRGFEPARSRAAIPSSGARGSGGGGLKMWRQPHLSACAQAHAAGGHLNIAQIMRGLRREAQVRTVGGVRGRRCLLAEPTAHNPCVMFQCPPIAPFQGDGGGLPPAMACGRH